MNWFNAVSRRPAATAGFLLVLALGAGWAQQEEAIDLSDAGFVGPESMLYHEAEDVYLVSNINGSPSEADGNGFISRVTPEGEVELKWIDGDTEGVDLDAPKGMAVVNDLLYVADVTNVRLFDAASGEMVDSVAVEGSSFLNDVVAHPEGGVLVTDTGVGPDFQPNGTAAVYRVHEDGTVERFASLTEQGMPNGIAATADGNFVVVTLATPGQVMVLGADGTVASVTDLEAGGFDGVVTLENGDLLVSSWSAGGILRIAGDGTGTMVLEGFEGPADIGFDTTRSRVLIPLLQGNAVHIVPLPEGE